MSPLQLPKQPCPDARQTHDKTPLAGIAKSKPVLDTSATFPTASEDPRESWMIGTATVPKETLNPSDSSIRPSQPPRKSVRTSARKRTALASSGAAVRSGVTPAVATSRPILLSNRFGAAELAIAERDWVHVLSLWQLVNAGKLADELPKTAVRAGSTRKRAAADQQTAGTAAKQPKRALGSAPVHHRWATRASKRAILQQDNTKDAPKPTVAERSRAKKRTRDVQDSGVAQINGAGDLTASFQRVTAALTWGSGLLFVNTQVIL